MVLKNCGDAPKALMKAERFYLATATVSGGGLPSLCITTILILIR
jgi:hypothetical protein